MSTGTSTTDASAPAPVTAPAEASAPSPFTMVAGAPDAMVCEGDVCFIPGA